MIYLFDKDMGLHKVVKSENVLAAIHEQELNGLILCNIELDLSYAKQFIEGAEYVGYYYKDVYYLHRIKRVEDIHEEEKLIIAGRHIFFDDMLGYNIIKDFRPQNRDAGYVLSQTIGTHTRWQIVSTDTTKHRSESFYYELPMEVLNKVVEGWQIEYKPEILFDGKQINGFRLHISERIGEDTHKRIPFGDRVLNLKYEMDYSEISTAVIGRGKGEEVGDGYGRRLEFTDSDFSREGVVSPVGENYMENPAITAEYGYDDGQPKFEVVVFDDIEDVSDLLDATYGHYLEVSRPKMLFEASVSDLGDVGIGDSLVILRLEYDVAYSVRIHKLTVDLHYPEDAQVELGDYAHFKESKVERKRRNSDRQWKRETTSMIERMKREFDEDFDGVVEDIQSGYEQAVIDANAETQAAEQRMETKITEERDGLQSAINTAKSDAIETATQNAETKAGEVQSNLEEFQGEHQQLYDDVTGEIFEINDFLGDKSDSLDAKLQGVRNDFEHRIDSIDSLTFNMLRGTRLDEPEFFTINGGEVKTDEAMPYAELGTDGNVMPYVRFEEMVSIESGTTYRLAFDFRSTVISELDAIYLQKDDGTFYWLHNRNEVGDGVDDLRTDGKWYRVVITFTATENLVGRIRIGTNFQIGDTTQGAFDIRLAYLTASNNVDWVYHALDDYQNIQSITRRVDDLEEGRSELVTRTTYNQLADSYETFTREYQEDAESVNLTLTALEDWQIENGTDILATVDGFQSRVWMNDVEGIQPNLFPASENAWEEGGIWTTGEEAPQNDRIRMKETIPVIEGETYTFTDDSAYVSSIEHIRLFVYDDAGALMLYEYVERGGQITFAAPGNQLRISLVPMDSFAITPDYIDHIDDRIRAKLERGAEGTPILNAISNMEQLADSLKFQVKSLDGDTVKQSGITVEDDRVMIGATEIGGETIGSILSLSPSGLDAVMDNFNLTGNLNVKGQIETLSVDAITGSFAEIFANTASIEFIDNVHLKSEVVDADKLLVNSALVDKLVTNSFFSNEISTLSLEAVHADLTSVNSEIMRANIIKSEWLDVDTALFDRLTANEAFISSLTSKTAFIRDIQAIEINANQINMDALANRSGEVEGGWTIRGHDNRLLVNNGIANWDYGIQMTEYIQNPDGVSWNGAWYETNRRTSRIVMLGAFKHTGRYLKLAIRLRLSGYSPSTSEYMYYQVDNEGGSLNYSVRNREIVYRGEAKTIELEIDLGVPTYASSNFYVRVWKETEDKGATNPENIVQLRVNRAWLEG